jgi:Trp operon repressor
MARNINLSVLQKSILAELTKQNITAEDLLVFLSAAELENLHRRLLAHRALCFETTIRQVANSLSISSTTVCRVNQVKKRRSSY